MRKRSTWWVPIASFVLVAAGLILPFWPLALLGMLLAAISGRLVVAILLGLLLDIVYGAPVGWLHVVYFPFTLGAFLGVGAHYYMRAYMR